MSTDGLFCETAGSGKEQLDGASAAQDIQEPESPQAKDALVTAIMTVKAVTLAVMNARGRQMPYPPHGQKERQQQAFQMCPHLESGRFDVPAARLGILKGGLHAHAQGIHLDAHLAGQQIGNDELCFLIPTGCATRCTSSMK